MPNPFTTEARFYVPNAIAFANVNVSNFHQLEVVGRGSEMQLQAGKNLNDLI